MDISILKQVLLWCTLINYGVLLVWYFSFVLAKERFYRLWERTLGVAPAEAAALNFKGIMYYKLAVILFNLVPCIALYIVS